MNKSMNEWEMYLDHGKSFLKCAAGGLGKPEKFNEDALFNLTALAIEKLSMGFLMKNSILPEGHSFQNLVESMNKLVPLSQKLMEEISRLDTYQESFCSLTVFRPEPITREELPSMLETCSQLQDYVQNNI